MSFTKFVVAISSVLLLSSCASAGSEAIQVFGGITVPPQYPVRPDGELPGDRDEQLQDGGPCYASEGYDDISEGSQVTVKNAAGEIVGVGSLSAGVQTGSEGYTYRDQLNLDPAICFFEFSFQVPSGEEFYSLSVGNDNRGEITYTAEELAAGVFLTLGE